MFGWWFFLSLFLLPVLPFRNHLFFFPHIPAVEYHLLGLLSPSSHSSVLLFKNPCSTSVKSLSFSCNSSYSPTLIPALVLHDWWGEASKAAADQVALEILVVCGACTLHYCLVKEWQTFPHIPSWIPKGFRLQTILLRNSKISILHYLC